MPKVDAHISIQRPAEVVFDYLADPRNVPEFSTAIQETRLDGDVGRGTRYRHVAKLLGRRIELEAEVTQYERPVRFGWRAVGDSSFPMDNDFTIEATESGACILHGDTGLDASGFFKLADWALAPIARRQFRHDLEALRDILEAGA